MIEKVYSGTWHIGKEGGLGKCEGSCRGIWGEDECQSKKAGEIGYGWGK